MRRRYKKQPEPTPEQLMQKAIDIMGIRVFPVFNDYIFFAPKHHQYLDAAAKRNRDNLTPEQREVVIIRYQKKLQQAYARLDRNINDKKWLKDRIETTIRSLTNMIVELGGIPS